MTSADDTPQLLDKTTRVITHQVMRELPSIQSVSHPLLRPRLLVPAGLLIAFALVAFGAVAWLKSQISQTGFTTDTALRMVIIGNDVLNIPANFIRFESQRDKPTLEQADLALLWPSGEGYSTENAALFQESGENSQLIFITLSGRKMRFDMTGRLQPIYLKLFEGPATNGPAGLKFQTLKKGSGYDDERLAIYAQGGEVWAARCQNESAPTSPTCLRDVFLGKGLSVSYRFPKDQLESWRAIEALVIGTIDSYLMR